MSRRLAVGLLLTLACGIGGAPADEPPEFIRVHVPEGRLRDVPLGRERHVPMAIADFERAVARLADPDRAAAAPRPLADSASYAASIDDSGMLVGTLSFEIGPATASLVAEMPLGAIDATGGTFTSPAGVGDVVLFGLPDGSIAVRTQSAGRYECRFRCPPAAADSAGYRLPLVPALATSVELALPAGLRPQVMHDAPGTVLMTPPGRDADAWRIEVAAADALSIAIVRQDAPPPRLRVWTRASYRGRQADVVSRIVPDAAWPAGTVTLRKDSGLMVTSVRSAAGADVDVPFRIADARTVVVDIPERLAGTLLPIDVAGAAESDGGDVRSVPTIRAPADRWAGGGLTVIVDSEFAVVSSETEECLVVSPETAARWPVPAVEGSPAEATAAVMHVEQQSAAGRVGVELRPRVAAVDVARVTTVEVSPTVVLGRAACDVRVVSGEAFEFTARVGPGWFIDSVEAVDWAAIDLEPEPLFGGRAPSATTDRQVDWRVVRSPNANELRIGIAEAATRSRGLGLRITGHRRGVPLGSEFMTGEMDMVRFDGERVEASLVDFRLGPEAVVEVDGQPIGLAAAEGRLAVLVEPGSPRGRVRGGDRAGSLAARLVQRRPPLEADVEVRMLAIDQQLSESFEFTCRPAAGAVDAVVVHVSEPLGDAVEWSLVQPEVATLLARRVEQAVPSTGEPGRPPADGESWLVEFRPAVEGTVAFRATRTLAFAAATPVPLAWVEGSRAARGTVAVLSGGRARPVVVNDRLRELPPAPERTEPTLTTVTELAYDDARALVTDGPAALLMPADEAAARAWAWREGTTCFCHASGRIESETVFDIENRGRDEVVLVLPRGLRLDEVIIDGAAVPVAAVPVAGGEVRVSLPPARERVVLVVRGVASDGSTIGAWTIDPIACTIDVPVLDRDLHLMLPPDVELVGAAETPETPTGWLQRLFDAGRSVAPPPATDAGFRRVTMTEWPPGRRITLVRRSLVASTSIAAGLAAAAAAWWLFRHRPPAAIVLAVAAALAALWMAPPFADVARASWWGAMAGTWWAGSRRRRPAAIAAACLLVLSAGASAEDDPVGGAEAYRVLLAPEDDGGVALVPEPLFRMLATDDAAAAAALRVTSCGILIGAADDAWRMTLEIDADRGGVLVLDQSAVGGRWRLPADRRPQGVTIDLAADGSIARLAVVAPGRHRVELDVLPLRSRRGGVETSVAGLPPAPRATVDFAASGAATDVRGVDPRRILCERADRDGPWRRARTPADAPGTFDVSRAARVRLTRSVDSRRAVATAIVAAESGNDVAWSETACRVRARYELDAGAGIVPSIIVRASPGLVPVAADTEPTICQPLGDGRYLVDVADPAPGCSRVDLEFAMPLLDPVGVFDVPGVWVEGVVNDMRTVRCLAPDDLDMTPELPGGVPLVRPREDDGPGVVAVWRTEAVVAAGDAAAVRAIDATAGERMRARVAVRRRPKPQRGTQSLQIDFATDHVGLSLTCQIDAASAPLVEVPVEVPALGVVDRVTLEQERDGEFLAVDTVARRAASNRLVVVVQRPRTGRFRLTVEARLPVRPAARGALPLLRGVNRGDAPLAVAWRAPPQAVVRVSGVEPAVDPVPPAESDRFIEVPPGSAGPEYVIVESDADDSTEAGRPPAVGPGTALGDAVAVTTVHLAIDRDGRGWGVARFELATSRRLVRLRLPPGMRLYDTLVDGREAEAVPQATDAWDVRLHDIRWPRSLVAVFAGDVGGRPEDGVPIRLDPPRLEGLATDTVLWAIDAPERMQVRITEPARRLSPAEWQAATEAGRERIAGLFATALDAAGDDERSRLAPFAALRAAGRRPAADAAWERAFAEADADGSRRVFAVVGGDGSLAVRAVRVGDATTPSRALATFLLLAAVVVGWSVMGRWPEVWAAALRGLWPWAVAAGGVAWIALLRPALPGWAILAAGIVAVAARRRGEARQASAIAETSFGSTRTFLVD